MKVQVFDCLMLYTVQAVLTCVKNIEILKMFTYIRSIVQGIGEPTYIRSTVQGIGEPRQESLRRFGLLHSALDSLKMSISRCRYLLRFGSSIC